MAFVDSALIDDVAVVNLGKLAVLRPLLQKLNVAAIIDRHCPSEAEFTHGTVLDILLAARLDSPTALVHVAQWAQDHGAHYLWDVPAEKLNDDRLARALDAFFEKRHEILADVTHEVLRLTQVTLERCHFDTTHLVLYGAFATSQPRPSGGLERLVRDLQNSPAHITRGYLTKYKMLQLGLTCAVDDLGALPVACHLFDGNRNGHTGIKQQYHLLRNYLKLPEDFLLVSDRGTCSAEHLARLLQHGHYALCAGQWQDYRDLYDRHAGRLNWQKASYLSREQQRRRDTASSLPLEEYRLAVVDHQLVDPTTKQPFDCRVVFTHSSAADRECKERRDKNVALIKAGLDKIARKLERAHPTTTYSSASRAIDGLLGKKAAAHYFQWQLVPLSAAEVAALPNPKKGYRKQSHRLVYSYDEVAAQADSHHDGVYALVSTAPRTISGDALFTQYKRQTYVERANHELKTPVAVTPLFLKTPRRIEALVSLLFVALQAAMTLERLYRQGLPDDAPQAERRMTAERILRKFRVCGLNVRQCAYGELVQATQLSAEQRRILNHLSLLPPAQILQQTLAPPPTD
jgi:transposase